MAVDLNVGGTWGIGSGDTWERGVGREESDVEWNARMSALRLQCNATPSPKAWAAVCETLTGWDERDGLDIAIEYVGAHLKHWPDALRVAPEAWLASLSLGRVDRRLRLARRLEMVGWPVLDLLSAATLAPLLNDVPAQRLYDVGGPRPGETVWELTSLRGVLARLVSSSKLSALVTLDLSDNAVWMDAVCVRVLGEGGALMNLRALELRENGLGESELDALAQAALLPSLERLDLSDNPLDGRSLETLGDSAMAWNLKTLNLSRCGFAPNVLVDMLSSPRWGALEELVVRDTSIDDDCLEALACATTLTGLKRLDVRGCRVSRDVVERLKGSPRLDALEEVLWDGAEDAA